MKKLIALVILAVAWGTFSYADFAGTGFSPPPFSIPNYWSGTGDYLKYDGTRGTPNQYVRASIPEPGVNDNTIIIGPLFRAWSIDNVTVVVMDNTGKLSGASTDNVTFNIQYSASSSFSSVTNVYTSDVTATGAAGYSGALNNTSPPVNGYIRISFSASNATHTRFYIQIRYKEL